MLNKIKKIFTDSHKEALKAGMVHAKNQFMFAAAECDGAAHMDVKSLVAQAVVASFGIQLQTIAGDRVKWRGIDAQVNGIFSLGGAQVIDRELELPVLRQ